MTSHAWERYKRAERAELVRAIVVRVVLYGTIAATTYLFFKVMT